MIIEILKLFPDLPYSEALIRFISFTTVRAVFSFMTALFFGVMICPFVIKWLKKHELGQVVKKMSTNKEHSLEEMHRSKTGTPTMGGVIIFLGTLLPVLIFTTWTLPAMYILLIVMTGSFLLGLVDDLVKMKIKPGWGLTKKVKILSQFAIAALAAFLVYYYPLSETHHMSTTIPAIKDTYLFFGSALLYMGWIIFIIIGSTNAVNLTDGLDGLAIGVCISVQIGLIILAYIVGRVDWSQYLFLVHIPQSNDIFIFLSAMLGASIAFLWFNAHPAEIFMGDSGALMLGAVMGTSAILLRQELLFAIFCGLLIIETLSVLIQVFSYRYTGKRVFKMAPIHHHFERINWPENKIVVRFWIVSFIFTIIGLGTLKLR